MYKKRFSAWKLGKYHREAEMRAIVRKTQQRTQPQKPASVYFIRGKVVHYRDAVRHLERKRMSINDIVAQRATCKTPEVHEVIAPSFPPLVALPEALATPEWVLRSIGDYYSGAFDSGMWLSLYQGHDCITTKDQKGRRQGPPGPLFNQCRIAVELFENNLVEEAGRTLVAATANAKQILLTEHPYTLGYMFKLMSLLSIKGKAEIASAITRYLHTLGQVLLGFKHPLVRICGWLASIEASQSQEVTGKFLQRSAETFKRAVGPMHRSTLKSWDIYAEALSDKGDKNKARALLLTCFLRCEAEFGPLDTRTLDLHLSLANHYLENDEKTKALKLGRMIMATARKLPSPRSKKYFFAEGLLMVSQSEYMLGAISSAIGNIRKAIDLRKSYRGIYDSRARQLLVRLETWLQEDGQPILAAEVREEWKAMLDPRELE